MPAESRLQILLFDLDGTLYLSGEPIGNNVASMNTFLVRDDRLAVAVTNNTSVSKADIALKLAAMGLNSAKTDIVSPTEVFAEYAIKSGLSRGYIVGNRHLKEDLACLGITHSEAEPEFVLVAFDTELTYEKLVRASALIHAGIPFFQTHIDLRCPVRAGFIPDCGAISSVITHVTGQAPILDFGKPGDMMCQYLQTRYALLPDRTAMIGDRLTTDIALGIRIGIKSVLVLSGESTEEMAFKATYRPDIIVPTMADFVYANV